MIRGKQFYTKGGNIIDITKWDTKGTAMDLYSRYGWEGAMAWGNLIHDELKGLNHKWPGVQPGDVYLDLGANIGLSSINAELKGASKIYCIEPDLGVYEALEMNKADNWETFNIAIADYNGEIDIPKWPDWWDNVKCKCITLEKFFNENNINQIDYMKVDIEGHEHQVLPSVSSEIYNKINKIFIEYHENAKLTKYQKDLERINFINSMLNKGYNNYHVALGDNQSFIYIWK